MKALVLFDTMTGNTEKIANALARGLKQHAATDCLNIDKVTDPHLLESYDALLIGAPTHFMTAPRHMKQFLKTLREASLAGKQGFAFDTRLESRFSGSAGNYIEKELKKAGLKIIRHEGSALIGNKSNQLEVGMEELFEGIGDEIGRMLVATTAAPA
ncbi:MAG: flavodoxin family protein [Nitrososphaera sp.]|jgi:flavodoxin